MTQTPEATPDQSNFTEPARRSFIYRLVTLLITAAVALPPLVAGLFVFFDPLRRRGKASASDDGETSEGNWLRVATLDAVPANGIPRQFPIIADQVDAWNRIPNQPIGLVYIRREPGSDKVEVLNAVCPHAGCFVALIDVDGQEQFRCPCHTSAFSLEGEKIDLAGVTNPSPRNMDPLKVDQDKLASTGEIWVDFKNFYPGKHERVAKS